jgi:hypothetical protein
VAIAFRGPCAWCGRTSNYLDSPSQYALCPRCVGRGVTHNSARLKRDRTALFLLLAALTKWASARRKPRGFSPGGEALFGFSRSFPESFRSLMRLTFCPRFESNHRWGPSTERRQLRQAGTTVLVL